MNLKETVQSFFSGEVADDKTTLEAFSQDASLFELTPQLVTFPKSVTDIENLVSYATKNPGTTITARSAGTDMTGGPLTTGIVLSMKEHFNHILDVQKGYAVTEPGVYYRDFEKETLKSGQFLPPYPASREICSVGGMVANNSGGEKSLAYHKTENYVSELDVVLADGKKYLVKPLTADELKKKIAEGTFESEIYRQIYQLIEKNYELIRQAKPDVSKNSAGYNLWDVWDRQTFDLTKLLVGSQGTFGIITKIKFRLVPQDKNSHMMVVFLKNIDDVVEVVNKVLPYHPTSFESYDNHTMTLALKYLPELIKLIKPHNLLTLAFSFIPEMWMIITGGFPKLVLLAEFTGDDQSEVIARTKSSLQELRGIPVKSRFIGSEDESRQYWVIRRESFNLLRHHLRGKQTAPFIDDLVVKPADLITFWPELEKILGRYKLTYTIAGHVGEGNFHIIPLMKLADPKTKDIIFNLSREVYDLVFKYKGSMTGEHNDGLIRSSYLPQMYGQIVYNLFAETKHIFDPGNIFNPNKKIGVSLAQSLTHLKNTPN